MEWLDPPHLITPLLFLRSHAAYRVACEHALAGQVAEVFPMLRSSLEYAGYALHIHANPPLAEVWLRRHDDDACTRANKDAFAIRRVRESIHDASERLALVYDTLYQRTIDFGAHPNEQGVSINVVVKEQASRRIIEQVYLHGDGPALDYGLRTTAQAGICALEILQEAFKARFEVLGVRAELVELRQGL